MSPVLIAAVLTLVGAAGIGVRLLLPTLRTATVQPAAGLTDAKRKVVDSTTRFLASVKP